MSYDNRDRNDRRNNRGNRKHKDGTFERLHKGVVLS